MYCRVRLFINKPNSWKDDSDVIDATENVLVKTGYYNKGFLQEIF